MRSKAFSLSEAVIALGIVCLMTSLGVMKFQEFNRKIAFDNSVMQFKMALEQAGRVATINNEEVKILYFNDSKCLEIEAKEYEHKVLLDQAIDSNTIREYKISEKGMMSPKTISFTDGVHHRDLKIQMAWGRIICEE